MLDSVNKPDTVSRDYYCTVRTRRVDEFFESRALPLITANYCDGSRGVAYRYRGCSVVVITDEYARGARGSEANLHLRVTGEKGLAQDIVNIIREFEQKFKLQSQSIQERPKPPVINSSGGSSDCTFMGIRQGEYVL